MGSLKLSLDPYGLHPKVSVLMVDHSGTAPESATPFCQGIKLQFCFEACFF